MTERTKEDLLAAIGQVNSAIQALVNGDRLRSLTVGSGEFQRRYSFSEITPENLIAVRDDLQKELDKLNAKASGATFRNARHAMTWGKGY